LRITNALCITVKAQLQAEISELKKQLIEESKSKVLLMDENDKQMTNERQRNSSVQQTMINQMRDMRNNYENELRTLRGNIDNLERDNSVLVTKSKGLELELKKLKSNNLSSSNDSNSEGDRQQFELDLDKLRKALEAETKAKRDLEAKLV
jgi:uncharacterized protein YsxB (DUF464 family)